MTLPDDQRSQLMALCSSLEQQLADNLQSLVLYGSSVRNDFTRSSSDINLMIVLKESTAAAQRSIATVIDASPLKVSPLVLSSSASERSMQMFALKFSDIARRDELLYGPDPFASFTVDISRRRFLLEQSLRNSLLRLSNIYIRSQQEPQRYIRAVRSNVPRIFADLAEILRLDGSEVPDERELQIPLFARELKLDPELLQALLRIRSETSLPVDIHVLHGQLLSVLEQNLDWMARAWEL
jgi:hypothetical protein